MMRLRFVLPKNHYVKYRNLDILHDAMINGLESSGIDAKKLIGMSALHWNFAPLGWRYKNESILHTLVFSTIDPELSSCAEKINPSEIKCSRASTSEIVDFSKAEIFFDPDPIAPGQSSMGTVMLSPLAISQKNDGKKLWHRNANALNIGEAISCRLSRIAKRPVQLSAMPDSLYIRCNPEHSTLVQIKEFENKRKSFVVGMRVPLVLQGNENDLRLAWYAGIGEKNRNGFGCIGLAERGIGR